MSINIGHGTLPTLPTVHIVILAFLTASSTGQYIKECHDKTFANPDHLFEHCRRIYPNSKYAAMSDPKKMDYHAAIKWCDARDMDIAVVTSLYDYKSLHKFLNLDLDYVWLLGSHDSFDNGYWIDRDGAFMSFQAFYTFEPLNASRFFPDAADLARSFIVLQNRRNSKDSGLRGAVSKYVNRDVSYEFSTKNNVAFFCEYKKISPCFKNSDETLYNNAFQDELKLLGETNWGKYYIGTVQKNWTDANNFCSSNQMKMLDMEFTTASEAEAAYNFLGKFIDDNDLSALATSFFLSGSFSKMFECEDVPFEWEWIDDIWRTKEDDSNKLLNYVTGQIKFGNCLSVGSLYKNKVIFTISAAYCIVPHWFVCVEAKD